MLTARLHTEHFIYVLWSGSANKFYVGYSAQVSRRLYEHNHSNAKSYTSKHRPWELVAQFKVNGTKKDALSLERFIKAQKSQAFIKRLIASEDLSGKLDKLVRVPKLRD